MKFYEFYSARFNMLNKKLILIFSILHFFCYLVALSGSVVIFEDKFTVYWRMVSVTLAFPCIYFVNIISVIDIFPFLVIINSLFWGVLITFLLSIFYKK